jgi:hypothetical protein
LVKDLGATLAIDYSSPDVVEQIKASAPDLAYAFDTIGNSSSSETASRAIKAPAHLCTVRPGKANTEKVLKGVEVTDVLVWTAFLKDHSYGKFHWHVSVLSWKKDFRENPLTPSIRHPKTIMSSPASCLKNFLSFSALEKLRLTMCIFFTDWTLCPRDSKCIVKERYLPKRLSMSCRW